MLYKNTFTYKLDRLCQDIRLYLNNQNSGLSLTENDFILIQYTYNLYIDTLKHYYIGFKFLNKTNREYKRYYKKTILPLFKEYYSIKELTLI
jgi:hypothetical protein